MIRQRSVLISVPLVLLGLLALLVAPRSERVGLHAQGTYRLALPLAARNHVFPDGRLSRFGLGVNPSDLSLYAVNSLRVGWYWDWRAAAHPSRPGGISYVQTIWINDAGDGSLLYTPSEASLPSIVAANPGSIWLIGNEPDCYAQAPLLPEAYARAYHELYTLLKSLDATAQVAAGQIVQPTPLRLKYLDSVLAAYRRAYGTDLPADLWAIHAYILNEQPGEPGAGVPPAAANLEEAVNIPWGENYRTAEVGTFKGFVRTFRTWMRDNGYRNVPLLITEFGVLIPDDMLARGGQAVGSAEGQRMILSFMDESVGFVQDATDSDTGLPHDNNRLVQGWAWYSLSDWSFGGPLFYDDTYAITDYGWRYAALAAQATSRPNLRTLSVTLTPTGGTSAVLSARVTNNGTATPVQPVLVRFYAGSPTSKGSQIGTDQWIGPMHGMATLHTASVIVPDTSAIATGAYVVVDPMNAVAESDEGDNVLVLP